MKLYHIPAFCILLILFAACRKSKTDHTSQIRSGTYVWMGKSSESNYPVCDDVFTEFSVTVVSESAVVVFGDTLRYSATNPITHELGFYHDDNPGYYHINNETFYYSPNSREMRYLSSHNSSYGGASTEVSTAAYRRFAAASTRVAVQGTRSLSGTRTDKVSMTGHEIDTAFNINQQLTFKPLTDSTIAVVGQVLQLNDSILYYKSIDPTNHIVIWQTHHTAPAASTLTYNYVTNQLTFEQLVNSQWSRSSVHLQ